MQWTNNCPYEEKDGEERGKKENQVARGQPRKRSRRKCRTCGGVREWLGRREKGGWKVGEGEAARDAFFEGEDEQGRDNRFS